MFVSIVITVKNEAESIKNLLDSLLCQEKPFEIIVVDAESSDGTQQIIKEYAKKYPEIKFFIHPGSRGEGRNFGAEKAKGELLAFIDGGCKADKNWLQELRKKVKDGYDVVAGKTINVGQFKETERVKVCYRGFDVTYPSCNLAYKKELFKQLGGFDARFITAEDIDLNYRAVRAGARIGYNKNAIVHRKTAKNVYEYVKQAFWYGYGRKQLTLKHGRLWKQYSFKQMFSTHLTFWGLLRLFFGLLGYLTCKITGGGMK